MLMNNNDDGFLPYLHEVIVHYDKASFSPQSLADKSCWIISMLELNNNDAGVLLDEARQTSGKTLKQALTVK